MADTVRYRRTATTARYRWPSVQLNIWILVFLASAATLLGVFAEFMTIQTQLQIGTPWYMPFWVATGAIAIIFVLAVMALASNRQLIPGIVLLGSFILFVLYLTGLIKISIELFGPTGGVNANCNQYVTNQEFKGQSINTLAWLEQNNICSCWRAAFSFAVIGAVLLLWMMVMAWQVQNDPR
ncbi:MAG: hypothetical protein M1826_003379 [Phylliscum demangeonii]|nr:MAG: hypothetical protein M1826_003379 [Phylliscum demangeonii]